MNLSEEDKVKVIEWVRTKCDNLRCHCCGMANWDLAANAVIALGYDVRSSRFHYHAGIPLVGLNCTNCGHFLLFSPLVMGIKPDLPESHPSNSAPKEGSSGEK